MKFDQISSCSNSPGKVCSGSACRKLELVRIDQLHTLDTKPTKVRTSQKGPFNNANGSGVPGGFEVGWYIYLPYMKTIEKNPSIHVGTTYITSPMGWYWEMDIGPFEWKMDIISILKSLIL